MAISIWRLLDLADMAERSVRDLPWVRWCVLWAAWQANALLRDYVEGCAGHGAGRPWSTVLMPAALGTDPADAQDLAASLRAFGRFMQATAAHLRRLSFLHQGQASDEAGNEGGAAHVLDAFIQRLATAASIPVEPHDTS